MCSARSWMPDCSHSFFSAGSKSSHSPDSIFTIHAHISVMMSLVCSQKCRLQNSWERACCCASVDVVLKCCYSCQGSLSLCWEWHPTELPSSAKLSALEGSQNSHKWDSAFLLRWVCALFFMRWHVDELNDDWIVEIGEFWFVLYKLIRFIQYKLNSSDCICSILLITTVN